MVSRISLLVNRNLQKEKSGKENCFSFPDRFVKEPRRVCAIRRKESPIIFFGDMCGEENTSQAASVEFVRWRRTNYARSRLQPLCQKVILFDSLIGERELLLLPRPRRSHFAVKQVLHGDARQIVVHDGVELFPHRQRQTLLRALAAALSRIRGTPRRPCCPRCCAAPARP